MFVCNKWRVENELSYRPRSLGKKGKDQFLARSLAKRRITRTTVSLHLFRTPFKFNQKDINIEHHTNGAGVNYI